MFFITYFVLWLLLGLIFEKLIKKVFISIILTFICFASIIAVISITNANRIEEKIRSGGGIFNNDYFTMVYEPKHYCYLTEDNYPDNHRLHIETYYFKKAVETELSDVTFYRIEYCDYEISEPIKSVWLKENHFNVVIIDGVMPCYKKMTSLIENDTPLIYKLFLPKSMFRPIITNEAGTLYLPATPVYVYGSAPEFLEYELVDTIEKAGSI